MSDGDMRTRLTEEQARLALHEAVEGVHLSPGSWQAVPRRRRAQRRRRALAVAANLAIVVAIAGVVTPAVREHLAGGRSMATPAAPSSTRPPSSRGPLPLQPTAPTAPLHVVASGSYHGKAWQFIAYRAGKNVCHGWNWAGNPGYRPGGNPSADGRWPSVNGGQSCEQPQPSIAVGVSGGTGQPVVVSGTVGKNVTEVRIFLRRQGSPTVVTVEPVGQELGMPVNFFGAVLAGTDGLDYKAVISKIVAYDRAGRPIARAGP
jgi:hypothetical protein